MIYPNLQSVLCDLLGSGVLAIFLWYMFRYYLWSAPYYSLGEWLWSVWEHLFHPSSTHNNSDKGLGLSDIAVLGLIIPWFAIESILPFGVIELKHIVSHQLSILDVLFISLLSMIGIKVINMLIDWALTYKYGPEKEIKVNASTAQMMESLETHFIAQNIANYLGVFLSCLMGGAIALLLMRIVIYGT